MPAPGPPCPLISKPSSPSASAWSSAGGTAWWTSSTWPRSTAAEEACHALGIRAVHLVVELYKEDAQALYRRVGFVAHDRELMTKASG